MEGQNPQHYRQGTGLGIRDSRLTGFSWEARGQRPLNTHGKNKPSGNIDQVEVKSLLDYGCDMEINFDK